ncbi:MAG: hypothetical protein QOG84_2847 [Sphingomonadales bacterium]|nr:hypothetical protein [Sphingomonadales bacterium]
MNPGMIALHVVAGGVAILSGYAALALPKGGSGHAKAGSVFFAAMLVMATMGGIMALAKGDPVTALAGPVVLYLVGTSRRAARLRSGEAARPEIWSLAAAATLALLFLGFGLYAAAQPNGRIAGYPPAICYVWSAILTLAATLDLNFLLRKRLGTRQRVARHLWRMCFALFVAAGSFFIGQQKVMPAEWRGWWGLLVPALAPLAAMAFWLVRVRFAMRFLGSQRPSDTPRPRLIPEPAR